MSLELPHELFLGDLVIAPSAEMRRAFTYIKPYTWSLAPVLALSLVSSALGLTQPYLTKVMVDRALVGRDLTALGWTLGGFVALTAASFALNVVSGLRYTEVSARILFDMRLDVFEHLQRLGPRYYAATPLGQIASRINSDIAEVQRVMGDVALAWIGQSLYLAGAVTMLVWLDWRLFLVSLALMPLALFALVRYRKRFEGAVAQVRDKSAAVGTFLIEAIQGVRLLVAYGAQARTSQEFARRNQSFVAALLAMRRLSYWSGGLPGVLLTISGAVVLFVGGWRVIHGAISLGTLVAFAAYQMRLLSPVQGLMGLYTSVASAKVSLRRVREILDAPPEVTEARDAVSLSRSAGGAMALRNVSYQFERGEVLRDLTLEVAARSWVTIVGSSGAGKSTIATLLARYGDPDSGTVWLDEHNLTALRLADVRREIVLVEAEAFVLHASVADNLRIANQSATDAQCVEALGMVAMDAWLSEASLGLQTVVGERGRALSTGERQRLGLARAILANPAVLVLDEATSALDPATEREVMDRLSAWLRQRTVIAISHRARVAGYGDRVVVLHEGTIRADGSPDALAARDPQWARLFERETARA